MTDSGGGSVTKSYTIMILFPFSASASAGTPQSATVNTFFATQLQVHVLSSTSSPVVEAVEVTLEKAGLHHTVAESPAMCFLDLSGYTRLTEERGDEAAAEIAATLGRLVQRSAYDHGGRPVKWLGDGVMLYFARPDGAVISALELADSVPAARLPPPHTGIDSGPVIFQDGDYFGRSVNVAARIAAYAAAGQVLVATKCCGSRPTQTSPSSRTQDFSKSSLPSGQGHRNCSISCWFAATHLRA